MTETQYGFPLDEENAKLFPLSEDSGIFVTTAAYFEVGCDSVQKCWQPTIGVPSAPLATPATREAMLG